jgi:DNA-directed RNA polymerase subunit RPC12/RpoP
MSGIDHQFTDEIVCPYCGYKFRCSSDIVSDGTSGTARCEECDKDFEWDANWTVTYTTEKIDQ